MSPIVTLLALAGCGSPTVECRATVDAWSDADGDGYGGEPLGKVCELGHGQVGQPLDCDDADPDRNPDAAETCDGIDDDCDGIVDDGTDLKQYWQDQDGDGYGAEYASQLACEKPGDDWVKNADDCDDGDGAIHPGVMEVCGHGDEDCDGYLDDADDNLDPASLSTFFRDGDGDGYGDPQSPLDSCRLAAGYVNNNLDCDDRDPLFAFNEYYDDADGDGFGDPATSVIACHPIPGLTTDDTDCDDANPDVHVDSNWYEDLDGDGYGAGLPVVTQCDPPGLGLVSGDDGVDCEPSDPDIHPDAVDVCEDGIDQDCEDGDAPCRPDCTFDQASYAATMTFLDHQNPTTMAIAFTGSNFWSVSGGGGGGSRMSEYDATGGFITNHATVPDFRSVFTIGDGTPDLYSRAYSSNVIQKWNGGAFVNFLTLVGHTVGTQAQVVWDDQLLRYVAGTDVGGQVLLYDAGGNFDHLVQLVGFGALGTEAFYPQNRAIAVGKGCWMTYSDRVLSTWDELGNRLDTATLNGAGTSFDSYFSTSYADGLVWVVDVSGGTWRGYDVGI